MQATTKPVVIHDTETITVKGDTETIYVPEPYPVIQEKIVTRLVPIKPREWESLEQVETMFKGNIFALQPNACLSVAQIIQQAALAEGYPVSIAFTLSGWYYTTWVATAPAGHAGIIVDIKGIWYFIDPIPWKVTQIYNENQH